MIRQGRQAWSVPGWASVFLVASLLLPAPAGAANEGGFSIAPPKRVSVAFSPRGEALEEILDELKRCRQRADVAMFYISNDLLIDALCYLSADRKIPVRVVVDEYMNSKAHRPTLDRLIDHGVDVHIESLPSGGKLHMKCAVIDAETVITGAANWTEYAFEKNIEDTVITRSTTLAGHYLDRIDALIAAAGWVERSTLASDDEPVDDFPEYDTPSRSSGKALQAPDRKNFSDIRSLQLYFNPGRDGLETLLGQIQQASRVDIGMYMLSDIQAIDGLETVAKAGKTRIRMLVDATMTTGSLLSTLQRLADAGIEIRYWEAYRSSLHLKTAVIDERYVWTGSANWSASAFNRNAEDMLRFESTSMARHYRQYLDEVAPACAPFVGLNLPDDSPTPEERPPVADAPPALPLAHPALAPVSPRTKFTGTTRRRPAEPFSVQASVEYLDDEEYLPVLLKTIRSAEQSIFISIFHIPVEIRTTRQDSIEEIIDSLSAAVSRGVYVYLGLEMPASPQDSLGKAHTLLAERLRQQGIDVRLSVPAVPLHEKLVVVDLCKVLVGSHNWSEGALTGKKVYESSALLVLERQEPKLVSYILSRNTISDMSNREAWEREINRLRHVAAARGHAQEALVEQLEAGAKP